MPEHQLADVIDFVAHVRDVVGSATEQDLKAVAEALPGRHGTLLGVVPVPGTGTALALVGHLLPTTEPTHLERHGLAAAVESGSRPPDPDDVAVDPAARRAWSAGRELALAYQEFELLAHLTAHPGQVFSRGQLLASVWGLASGPTARTVDVHIHRLRRKLGVHGGRLVTIRRIGYKYDPSA
jgi:hypothetical protein